MKFSLNKIQEYIVEPLPDVEVLREKIIFHAFEVESIEQNEDDYELDIKILPDRAFDAKTEQGLARELAALFGLTLKNHDEYEPHQSFTCSLSQLGALLGIATTAEMINQWCSAYHYHYKLDNGSLTFFIPPWRNDILHEYDLADEIGRYFGYEMIPALLPKLDNAVVHDSGFTTIVSKRHEMVEKGYHEVMTYSLTKKGDFQVAKGPKGKDFLRKDLLTGLRAAYILNKQNEVLLPNHKAKIFEIGKVFPKSGEELHIAWIDKSGEHEEVIVPDKELSRRPMNGAVNRNTEFAMWSEFPFMTRDVALWVPEGTRAQAVIEVIKSRATRLLVKDPYLFDTFTKEGRTSLAFRLIFQSHERTLTEDELVPLMDAIYNACKENNWEIR